MDAANSFERKKLGTGKVVYLIMRGQVEIRRGVRTSYPRVVATLGPGDICGEMALFDDRPRMASAVTVSDCELVAVSREEFVKRLEDMNPVMRRILQIMVGRVRSMTDEFMTRKTQTRYKDIFQGDPAATPAGAKPGEPTPAAEPSRPE
jgi:CRP-like cAMP-binding protein